MSEQSVFKSMIVSAAIAPMARQLANALPSAEVLAELGVVPVTGGVL